MLSCVCFYMVFLLLFFLTSRWNTRRRRWWRMTCSLIEFKLDMAMTHYSKMNAPINGGEVEDFIHSLRQCEPSLFMSPWCLYVRMNKNSHVDVFSAYCKACIDLNIYFYRQNGFVISFFNACYESTSKSVEFKISLSSIDHISALVSTYHEWIWYFFNSAKA